MHVLAILCQQQPAQNTQSTWHGWSALFSTINLNIFTTNRLPLHNPPAWDLAKADMPIPATMMSFGDVWFLPSDVGRLVHQRWDRDRACGFPLQHCTKQGFRMFFGAIESLMFKENNRVGMHGWRLKRWPRTILKKRKLVLLELEMRWITQGKNN